MEQQPIEIFTRTILELQRNVESLRGEVLIVAQTIKDAEGRNEKYRQDIDTRINTLIADINRQNMRSEVQDATHTEQLSSLRFQIASSLSSLGKQYDSQNRAIVELIARIDSIQDQCDLNSQALLVFRSPLAFITSLSWQDRVLISSLLVIGVFFAILFINQT